MKRPSATNAGHLREWLSDYRDAQKAAFDAIPLEEVERMVWTLREAREKDRQIFVFGNGGSAANASHFAAELGHGASDAAGRFRVLSLNDNVSWMTAIGNDYGYEDVFARQLRNYGHPGDVALAMSVSGNSPNVVRALEWAKDHRLIPLALAGNRQSRLAEIADQAIVVEARHCGRAEDSQMAIGHMICYAFMEGILNSELKNSRTQELRKRLSAECEMGSAE